MKNQINKLEKYIKSNFIFFNSCIDILGNDVYFCTCGNKIIANPNESSYSVKFNNLNDIEIADVESAYRKANIICSKCKKNYTDSSVYTTIHSVDIDFFDKYELHESKSSLTLSKLRVKTNYNTEDNSLSFNITDCYITISKKSKRIKFKNFNSTEEENVHLENIIDVSKKFFANGKSTEITEGFINVHDFIGRVSKIIIDAKNMHVIDELMTLMIGKSGTNILQRTLAIFMGIMCYPSLATISLTKGNLFLYDLLENCPLPSRQYLSRHNATAPLKIFNTLVSLKNNLLQKELDTDDLNKLGYVFKSKYGASFNIKYNLNELDKIDNAKKIGGAGAKIFVRDEIVNKKISPFIFNKIRTFRDYENLIQWMKFISYNDLIKLVMKYDMELLNIIFKKIEFRDDITFERLSQFIPLMLNYAQFKKANSVFNVNGFENGINLSDVFFKKTSQYEAINYFDFNLYDDCMRMIMELKWDPEKVLYKTKDYEKLGKLHENLIKFRSYISDKEANEKYVEFSSKFNYLTGTKKHEELGYSFDIKIIPTPEELLNAAIELHNCAGSYIAKVANGMYVPFILYDNSTKRNSDEYYKYMMILEVTNLGLEFVGVKSNCNQYGSDRFKADIINYLIENDISFKEVPSIKPGVQSTELSYAGTFEKVERK